METNNPVIPQIYDVTWSVVAIASVALVVVALVSLSRTAPRLSPWLAVAWVALIVVVPILGAVAWLAIGRRAVPGERLPR
ncbi:phospholipase D-like protein [Curtobacterium flaccumfaciens]|uniref:Phospholipase D-like protein n=1 Tax=Curtobacterium flaccumfaciens TaxID=2035 RepID=A0A4R6DKU1_9MICO|nr:PLDc N-terminal domain-containing protein [Curtobacterium flaccumfaciens]TDN45486.1 phospholipase D-like protein [Curtobacterium flaccumfaciens]